MSRSPSFLTRGRSGGVLRLVLDRPPVNVLHIPMLRELAAALAEVPAEEDLRVLLITGQGKTFCAGVDVDDHTEERVEEMLAAFHGVLSRILTLELPTVAAVNGAALGGGLELASACDVIVARAGAKLGQPEVRLGAFPPAAAALLPRLVGRSRALDLILTGRTFPAEEGEAMGLVARTLPAEDFEARVDEYARGLASLSGPVLRLAKRAVVDGLDRSLGDALERAEDLYLEELVTLSDAREGLAAFQEKRPPAWSHA